MVATDLHQGKIREPGVEELAGGLDHRTDVVTARDLAGNVLRTDLLDALSKAAVPGNSALTFQSVMLHRKCLCARSVASASESQEIGSWATVRDGLVLGFGIEAPRAASHTGAVAGRVRYPS